MPIINNIPRRQGRIFNHPALAAPASTVFGPRGMNVANVGTVNNPSDPVYLTTVGRTYNQVSRTGISKGTHPVGMMQNTATQRNIQQLSNVGQTGTVPQSQVPEVAPNEKGSFFSPGSAKRLTIRASGVNPSSNTPFHPANMPAVARPRRYPTPAGERTSEPSFGSSHTLLGNPFHDTVGSRWAVIKHGAVHQPDKNNSHPLQKVAGFNSDRNTGTGSTGAITTTPTPATPVTSNAHSGSPFVVAWVPQPRGQQPNEKGNINPISQKGNCNKCG